MPSSAIGRSYGNLNNFLRHCKSVFQSGCSIFHFHQQGMKVPFFYSVTSTHYHVFLIIVILLCVKWYLILGLIYIALMIDEAHIKHKH